jgi:hypothetical protein
MEQCFTALSDIVDELKETQIERESVLRDPSVRTKPRAQERPESRYGVHVDLVVTVPIFVSGILSGTMADGTVDVAPLGHSRIVEKIGREVEHVVLEALDLIGEVVVGHNGGNGGREAHGGGHQRFRDAGGLTVAIKSPSPILAFPSIRGSL